MLPTGGPGFLAGHLLRRRVSCEETEAARSGQTLLGSRSRRLGSSGLGTSSPSPSCCVPERISPTGPASCLWDAEAPLRTGSVPAPAVECQACLPQTDIPAVPPVSVRVNNTSACCLEPVQTGFLESALSLRLHPGKGHVEPSDVMGSKTDSAVFFPSFLSSLNRDMCVLQVEGVGASAPYSPGCCPRAPWHLTPSAPEVRRPLTWGIARGSALGRSGPTQLCS